jgi:phosphoribosyl-dephospho-CoA transferase
MAVREPQRHDIVRLAPGWLDHARTFVPPAFAGEIVAWAAGGGGFVVGSATADDAPDDLRLGLATPDKRRLGCRVGLAAVADVTPPLLLADATGAAPAAWRVTIARVLERTAAHGATVRVYGSLGWQARTGLAYLRPESDLDLLLACPDAPALTALGRALAAITDGPRLDGEAVLPDGGAVAWREWAGPAPTVLVKARRHLALVDREAIRRRFDRGAS